MGPLFWPALQDSLFRAVMTWSASVAVRIASSRDSDMGTCPTTCTCSKSLCSPSVVGRYARESVSVRWRFFPCTYIKSTSYFCSRIIMRYRRFGALAKASLRFVVGNDVHLPAVLVEFLQTPHWVSICSLDE